MVTSVTNFGRSGLSDWLTQRISAVILLLYVLCLGAIILTTPEMSYAQWRGLFTGTFMRIFSLLTLVALCAHAWIGMWTVATDYMTTRMMGSRATVIRLLFLILCVGVLAVYFIWGIMILWSV
ncbi:MAG: succinate dehydrogenase / fumarate reductase membrane anchor subunit [Pseudohongiellaceae bacterium]|jgi:succinate dehydrogenase / fumarate reductase membrane anchor subunit|tara:strand:- start:1465 stop:1833 length:369 start_codon:yes stop_codon:yes gene_type:complete